MTTALVLVLVLILVLLLVLVLVLLLLILIISTCRFYFRCIRTTSSVLRLAPNEPIYASR